MSRPRLLLADDHTKTRELLCDLLEPDFDVVAQVKDGLALVQTEAQLSPDVIVTDISMPGLDGIAAAAAILRRNPVARIVFVTVNSDVSLVRCGLATGALGYVLKLAAGDDLIPAVHAALRGEQHISQILHYHNGTTGTH
jgi:DNA-binding NarL/FixJ family response regulator